MCFRVVGRNRGAPRRLVGAPKRACISLPTRGNSCCFAPGRPNTKHRNRNFHHAPQCENPLNYCVLAIEIRILRGAQMTPNMPPGTTSIAETLQIHCVSAHAQATHRPDTRNVIPPASPNTANSCAFASSAGIGVRYGAMLVPQSGPAFNCQHVEIHAVLRQGDHTRITKTTTSLLRRIAKTL